MAKMINYGGELLGKRKAGEIGYALFGKTGKWGGMISSPVDRKELLQKELKKHEFERRVFPSWKYTVGAREYDVKIKKVRYKVGTGWIPVSQKRKLKRVM